MATNGFMWHLGGCCLDPVEFIAPVRIIFSTADIYSSGMAVCVYECRGVYFCEHVSDIYSFGCAIVRMCALVCDIYLTGHTGRLCV